MLEYLSRHTYRTPIGNELIRLIKSSQVAFTVRAGPVRSLVRECLGAVVTAKLSATNQRRFAEPFDA